MVVRVPCPVDSRTSPPAICICHSHQYHGLILFSREFNISWMTTDVEDNLITGLWDSEGSYWLFQKKVVWSSLTHWGRVAQTCVSKIIIIDSNNGLSPGRRQAIIWTNAGILSTGPLGINFSEILIFQLRKCIWKCHLPNGGHLVLASMYLCYLAWHYFIGLHLGL